MRYDILSDFKHEVAEERERQVRRFGDRAGEERGLPFTSEYTAPVYDSCADAWKRIADKRGSNGTDDIGWDCILLEEVYEALGEEDPDKMQVELVQVAAVCAAMYEDIARRRETAEDDAERERRAAGQARYDRIFEETAEAREAQAIEHVENLFPSIETEAQNWFDQNGFVVRQTVDLPNGTMFMFATEQDLQPYVDRIDEEIARIVDVAIQPIKHEFELASIRPTEGVSWGELVGDPVLGGGIEETGIPAPQTFWGESALENIPGHIDSDPVVADYFLREPEKPSHPFTFTFPADTLVRWPVAPEFAWYGGDLREADMTSFTINYSDVNPAALDVLYGGKIGSFEYVPPRPETEPFGDCCPHGVQDPDSLLP